MPPATDSLTVRARGHARWLAPLALFLGTLALYLPTAGTGGGHMDYWSADFASWRLATTGSPNLEDAPGVEKITDKVEAYVWITERDGHLISPRSPGAIVAGLPLYWVTHPARMTLLPASGTAALLVATANVLMYLALITRLSRKHALLAVLGVGLTTPVWSIAADGLWPQTLTTLGIAGMAWGLSRGRWWAVGLFGGVALWARAHASVIPAVAGIGLALWRRQPVIALKVGAVSGFFMGLLSLYCHWMYGSWDPLSYRGGSAASAEVAEGLIGQWRNYAGMWVAPDRGILIWTPALLLLVPAVWRSWRTLPDWSRTLLVAGFVYTELQSFANIFTGGDNFYGYRLGIEFLVCATPAVAFSVERAGNVARRLLAPVIGLQLGAFTIGSTFWGLYIPEDRVWVDNAFVGALRQDVPFTVTVVLIAVVAVALIQHRVWPARREVTVAEPSSPDPVPAGV